MDRAKLVLAVVVMVAGTYLWYQRGLLMRDHELCLDATQALNEQMPDGAQFDKEEDMKDYIASYTSWYQHCRNSRYARRNPRTAELMKKQANRFDQGGE